MRLISSATRLDGSPASRSVRRPSRRNRFVLISCGVLVGALVPVVAMANLAGSDFESTDGNLVVTNAGKKDWTTAPNRVDGVEENSGKEDNSLGQGAKEDLDDTTVVNGSIPPNKSDLTRFYVANEKLGGDHFLYLAWERTNTLGSANMDFEINKLAQPDLETAGAKELNRSLGDLLVRYDFSNGGTVPTLSLVKWITAPTGSASDCFKNQSVPCWGALPADDDIDGTDDQQIQLSSEGIADGSINSTTVPDPIAGVQLPEATFGEAAINLTDAGVFPEGQCVNFGSVYLKSRSAAAFDAELKDFIAPESVSINNCGNLVIRKITIGGTGTFGFNSPNAAITDQTPSDSATKFELTTTSAGTAASTGTLYHGLLAGTYNISENGPPAGWELTSATCDNGDLPSAVTVVAETTVTCTFTNTAKATLVVAKETNPDASAQSFTFTKTSGFGAGNGGTFGLTDGQNTGTTYANIAPGTYVVTETVPTGWKSPPAIVCTGDSGTTGLSSGTGAAATFNLQPGETVTCTFTNTELAKVTITKQDDDSPPNAVNGATFGIYEDVTPASTTTPGIEDFDPSTPNSPAPLTTCVVSSGGTCSTANVLDPSKAYWVVETTTPAGYTTADPQRITPTAGQNVALTFVDKREFKVITLVCQNSNNSLYPSSVSLDKLPSGSDSGTSLSAAQLAAFNTANNTNITAAQLCALTGAVFSPRHHGTYNGSVTIPQ